MIIVEPRANEYIKTDQLIVDKGLENDVRKNNEEILLLTDS